MRLSRSRVKVSDTVCQEISKDLQSEGFDPPIPSFCNDADHKVNILKHYISSLLKSFYRLNQENRLLRLQLGDLRCVKVNRWRVNDG